MKKPNLMIVGPIFHTPAGPGGMGGQLYLKLKMEGYAVYKKSAIRNKFGRMIDILGFVLFRRKRFDIIFLQSFGLLAFVMEDMVSQLAIWFKKPIVFTIRGGAFHEFYSRNSNWCNRVLKRANLINTPSRFLQSFLIEQGFLVNYTPDFVDLSRFPYLRNVNQCNSLLWVRAFHEIYHPELAIETVAALRKDFPDIQLTMIGPDMGLQQACEALIVSKGIERHVRIVGSVPNDQLFQYYQSHQVYLNTTRYESFGVALVEAGACGIPCVSTAVGEIPYLWEDQKNILLADREPEAFAGQVLRLFTDVKLREKIALNARKNAEQFTWENVRHRWISIIDKLSN